MWKGIFMPKCSNNKGSLSENIVILRLFGWEDTIVLKIGLFGWKIAKIYPWRSKKIRVFGWESITFFKIWGLWVRARLKSRVYEPYIRVASEMRETRAVYFAESVSFLVKNWCYLTITIQITAMENHYDLPTQIGTGFIDLPCIRERILLLYLTTLG